MATPGAILLVDDEDKILKTLGRALRGANPSLVVGIGRGLVAARLLRVPGWRVAVGVIGLAILWS